MNKVEERRLFERVFSTEQFSEVQATECPDFVALQQGKPLLGVEVTELFTHEAAARLQKIPGYVGNILDGAGYLHKKDIKLLPVETFVYHPKGRPSQELQGIVREWPKFEQRVRLLRNAIDRKATRISDYKQKAQYIDLIVNDCDRMFSIRDPSKASKLFLSEHLVTTVLRSGFREIHLVTLSANNRMLILPARLNIFAEEVLRCEHAILEISRQQSCDLTVGDFGTRMRRYLIAHGFPEVRIFLVDGEIIISTDIGHFIRGTKRRELKDSIGAHEFGIENEFPVLSGEDSDQELELHRSIAEFARMSTMNISLSTEIQSEEP